MEQKEPKKVTLPSGAILTLYPSPFKDARKLMQALVEEIREIKVDPNQQVDVNMWKDFICAGLASQEIERALQPCMYRCLYDDFKITDDTFEPIAARNDYLTVVMEVVKENVLPFTKSLYAEFANIIEKLTPKGLA